MSAAAMTASLLASLIRGTRRRAYSRLGEREREPVGHARDVIRHPRRQVALAVGEEPRVGDEPGEDRAHDPLGPLVLRHCLRPEVDAVEHERAQREHRLSHLVTLDDLAGGLGRLDEVVDERIDPFRAARSEQRDLGGRQVVLREEPVAERVVDVVVDVGDPIDDPHDLPLVASRAPAARCA